MTRKPHGENPPIGRAASTNTPADPNFEAEAGLYREGEAPPGMEDVVRALKEDPDVENPYAVAWAMHNKEKRKSAARRAEAGARWLRLHPQLALRAANTWAVDPQVARRIRNGFARRADLRQIADEIGIETLSAAIDRWATCGCMARQEPVVLVVETKALDTDGVEVGAQEEVFTADNPLALLELGSSADPEPCEPSGMDVTSSLPLEGLTESDEGVYEAPPVEDQGAGLIILKTARFFGSPGQLAAVRRVIRSAQAVWMAGPDDGDFQEEAEDEELFRFEIERFDGEAADIIPATLSELEDGILQRALGIDEDSAPIVVPCEDSATGEALEFEDEDGQVIARVQVFEEDDEPADSDELDEVAEALGAGGRPQHEPADSGCGEDEEGDDSQDEVEDYQPLNFDEEAGYDDY